MSLRSAILLALAAVPAMAVAHEVADPRVVVLVARPHELELRVNDLEQPGRASVELRRRFDGNRNGTLDDAEREDLAAFLAARATSNLAVHEAGAKGASPLSIVSRTLRGDDGAVDASTPLSVDVVLRTALSTSSGTAALTVRDWRADGHPVRVAVRAEEVQLQSIRPGRLAKEGRLATGIALTRTSALEVRFGRPPRRAAE